MSDQSEQADELEAQVISDVEGGISSFSDGTHSVSAISPKERLEVVDRLRRSDATKNSPMRGLKFSRMVPPGCG